MRLVMTALVVPDYDEAIAFFTGPLGFRLLEDKDMGGGKRWVVVGTDGGGSLLLAKATSAEQQAAIGNQTGGRVGWFVHCHDFAAAHDRLTAAGVAFVEEPRHEAYGTVAVFEDPYGNRWDLIEPKEAS